MTSHIVAEIQAVVDKLHSEGSTIATRLENALAGLKAHFEKDAIRDEAAVASDVKQVEVDAAPVVAEIKADTAQVVTDVKGQVEANLAEAADVLARGVTKK